MDQPVYTEATTHGFRGLLPAALPHLSAVRRPPPRRDEADGGGAAAHPLPPPRRRAASALRRHAPRLQFLVFLFVLVGHTRPQARVRRPPPPPLGGVPGGAARPPAPPPPPPRWAARCVSAGVLLEGGGA